MRNAYTLIDCFQTCFKHNLKLKYKLPEDTTITWISQSKQKVQNFQGLCPMPTAADALSQKQWQYSNEPERQFCGQLILK